MRILIVFYLLFFVLEVVLYEYVTFIQLIWNPIIGKHDPFSSKYLNVRKIL